MESEQKYRERFWKRYDGFQEKIPDSAESVFMEMVGLGYSPRVVTAAIQHFRNEERPRIDVARENGVSSLGVKQCKKRIETEGLVEQLEKNHTEVQ